ncbi:MAG: pilus assembly protein N-terminal domain-containing protein [Ottowia sp.]|uniref:beta strand repeat-containing protein n=1 Tax=Ottowia sp. TaxID=1898956 RepID=UPI003C7396A4
MRRFFLGFLALLVALGVASCGGGGGYDGTTGNNNSLRMSPLLSDVGLSVGYVAKVTTISQGVKPYHVLSSDPSVSAVLLDDDTLLVRGNSLGTSTVAVQDSSVNQTSISMTVKVTAQALATSVGTALTLGAGESRTFTVTGGAAPYTVTSNNNSIAAVTALNGGVVTVTGRSKGAAALLITDDVGSTLQVAVTVNAPDFSVSPGTATGQVGTEMVFSILGGIGPYTAVSSAPSVASLQVIGDTARAQLKTQGTSTLTFRDSTGQSFVVTLTSTQTLPPLSISPTSGSGQVGTSLVFTAIGGAGPFTAISSNPSVATASASGSVINVSLQAAGASTITVLDSKGQSASVSVTASATSAAALAVSPPSATGQVGSNMVLVISGGKGGYTAVSSNPSVVNAVVSGDRINVSFLAAGSSTITVIDSAGAFVAVSMTATSTVPGLTVNPPSASGLVGTQMNLNIIGGVGPYTGASSNPSIASVTLNGNVAQVTFNAVGSTSFTVLDSRGQSATVQLTSTLNATPLTASPTSVVDTVGHSVVFTISGGTGPYTAVSSNPQLSTPSVNGSTVTVVLFGKGDSTITIQDANRQTIAVTITADDPSGGGTGTTLKVAPQNQAIDQGSLMDVSYAINNGTGPYLAYVAAGDAAIASASVTGNTLKIGVGSSGNRCVGTSSRIVQVTVLDTATGETTTATETIVGGATCP